MIVRMDVRELYSSEHSRSLSIVLLLPVIARVLLHPFRLFLLPELERLFYIYEACIQTPVYVYINKDFTETLFNRKT